MTAEHRSTHPYVSQTAHSLWYIYIYIYIYMYMYRIHMLCSRTWYSLLWSTHQQSVYGINMTSTGLHCTPCTCLCSVTSPLVSLLQQLLSAPTRRSVDGFEVANPSAPKSLIRSRVQGERSHATALSTFFIFPKAYVVLYCIDKPQECPRVLHIRTMLTAQL